MLLWSVLALTLGGLLANQGAQKLEKREAVSLRETALPPAATEKPAAMKQGDHDKRRTMHAAQQEVCWCWL